MLSRKKLALGAGAGFLIVAIAVTGLLLYRHNSKPKAVVKTQPIGVKSTMEFRYIFNRQGCTEEGAKNYSKDIDASNNAKDKADASLLLGDCWNSLGKYVEAEQAYSNAQKNYATVKDLPSSNTARLRAESAHTNSQYKE